jgi:hypothetical protein
VGIFGKRKRKKKISSLRFRFELYIQFKPETKKKTMNTLLHPTYLPSISHFVANRRQTYLEIEDNFQNKPINTYIYSPNDSVEHSLNTLKPIEPKIFKSMILTGRNNITSH